MSGIKLEAMSKIKTFFQVLGLLICIILLAGILAFPVIISIITGNWWFLFLYFAIGVPFILVFTLLTALIELN
jgi:hypothetical protein